MQKANRQIAKSLNRQIPSSPGSPWRVRPRIQRRRPRDQRRNFKTRCGLGINTESAILQAAYGVEAGLLAGILRKNSRHENPRAFDRAITSRLAVRGATAADT